MTGLAYDLPLTETARLKPGVAFRYHRILPEWMETHGVRGNRWGTAARPSPTRSAGETRQRSGYAATTSGHNSGNERPQDKRRACTRTRTAPIHGEGNSLKRPPPSASTPEEASMFRLREIPTAIRIIVEARSADPPKAESQRQRSQPYHHHAELLRDDQFYVKHRPSLQG